MKKFKLKLTKNQLKVTAEIFEKIGLAFGVAVFINSFITEKTTVSGFEIAVISVLSIGLLISSIIMRK